MDRSGMRNPKRASQLPRSIGAVFAGLVAVVLLSTLTDLAMHSTGVFPPEGQPMTTGLWLLATAYRLVYGALGSYIAARLAPDRPMGHAMALGIVGVVLSSLGLAATWGRGPEFGPAWYPIGLVVTALPMAWLGGRLAPARPGEVAR